MFLILHTISHSSVFIRWNFILLQVVNFGSNAVTLKISIDGIDPNLFQSFGCTKTVLTSINVMDENSFIAPTKVFESSFIS